MLGRLGKVLYWCSLAIALAGWIAGLIILMAIVTGQPSDSEVWMAAVFFAAVGISAWLFGRAIKYVRL